MRPLSGGCGGPGRAERERGGPWAGVEGGKGLGRAHRSASTHQPLSELSVNSVTAQLNSSG